MCDGPLVGKVRSRDPPWYPLTLGMTHVKTVDIAGNKVKFPYSSKNVAGAASEEVKSYICRNLENTIVFPGESIQFQIPREYDGRSVILVPRPTLTGKPWIEPQSFIVQNGSLTIQNRTESFVHLKKNQLVADVKLCKELDFSPTYLHRIKSVNSIYDINEQDWSHLEMPIRETIDETINYIEDIKIDPDKLWDQDTRDKFLELSKEYSDIITPIPGRYNGASGHVWTGIDFRTIPPPSYKARIPNYPPDQMRAMADIMDKMLAWKVLMRPEDVGIIPRWVVPSMLLPKPDSPGSSVWSQISLH